MFGIGGIHPVCGDDASWWWKRRAGKK